MADHFILTAAHESDLERRIRVFLEGVGRERLRRLDVRVQQGVAFLSGHVSCFYERQLAISACQRVAGVYRVTDEIEVDR